jgi:hypothetical protein
MDGPMVRAETVGSALFILSARHWHWAGGRGMRSECMAAPPQLACCYTWKLPATLHMRPVLLDHTHGPFLRTDPRPRRKVCRAEHPSIPWKAYLASREFQNLASGIADAVFTPSNCRQGSTDAERPLSLTAGSPTPGRASGKPSGGLLARVLPDEAGPAPQDADEQASGLAMAA